MEFPALKVDLAKDLPLQVMERHGIRTPWRSVWAFIRIWFFTTSWFSRNL
jgi:hypothetical protein